MFTRPSTALILVGSCALSPFAALAQPPDPFTSTYAESCAVCHGTRLEGTPGAPALADEGFRRSWQGRTARELLDCTRNTMPPGRLGTLSDEQHASLVAVILEANGVRPRPPQ